MSKKESSSLSAYNFSISNQFLCMTSMGLEGVRPMGICDCCGNNYDKSFEVIMNGQSYTFDSFECAVHTLAPKCAHCSMKIIGHGVESNDKIFCCANCSKHEGIENLKDRAENRVNQ